MGNKLYVGNLPYTVRDEDLQQAFGQFGAVTSAKVMMERDTGRSKGFGFVEMGSDAEAQAAIDGMNGQSLGGRSITVNEARPMEARPPRTGGFGGGGDRYRRWWRLWRRWRSVAVRRWRSFWRWRLRRRRRWSRRLLSPANPVNGRDAVAHQLPQPCAEQSIKGFGTSVLKPFFFASPPLTLQGPRCSAGYAGRWRQIQAG